MQRRRISSSDVARKAGVSRTTVSFVLNNTPGKTISEETRQRVLEVANTLGYEPNINARRLAMIRDKAIGLFICQSQSVISDSYVIRLIEGMSQVLNRKRHSLVLEPLRLAESDYLEIALRHELDGVVLLNAHENDEGIRKLKEADFPLVIVGTLADSAIYQVDIDNHTAAEEMAMHVISLGHESIGMIVHAPIVFHAARERLSGFRSAIERSHLSYNPEYVRIADFTEESGYIAMQELLALENPPTAVFAGNDLIAYGAYRAARDMDLNIPGDISIVGFDDDYLSRYLNPPLTTMNLPAAGLGSIAAGLVAQLIAVAERRSGTTGTKSVIPGASVHQTILPTRISVRSSCRRL